MRIGLLYRDTDRDRPGDGAYADAENIIRDLGLDTLFRAAGRRLILENGAVKRVEKEDPYLVETMRMVMPVPLASREEIAYRQAILRDAVRQEGLLRELYRISGEAVRQWNGLWSGVREKSQQRSPAAKLADQIRALHLLCDSLREVRGLLTGENGEAGKPAREAFASDGLRGFCDRFLAAFSEERESDVRKVLESISFYTESSDEKDGRENRTLKPRIVLECSLEDGLKISSMRLVGVSTENLRFYRPGTTRKKLQEYRYSRIPDSFSVEKDMRLSEQARQLEFGVVSHLYEQSLAGMMEAFQPFFGQLKRQTAFYLGAVQLMTHIGHDGMQLCFPEAADRETLAFRGLQECVMGLERRMDVVGNTCSLDRKSLLIVTGANQGGKSTFLRSIGIAQVMMQCGLPVAAQAFRSGIFPRIFVHFTRREDSSMNSGRLDEELCRMNRIVEQIGDGSLVLLNESFATTTEKDGAVIAYDIVRALCEAGVKVLMVTHLLPFARRMYEETKADPAAGAAFLSAERQADGSRTYRMIPHAPETTSFGLDLYEEIVEKKPRRK